MRATVMSPTRVGFVLREIFGALAFIVLVFGLLSPLFLMP